MQDVSNMKVFPQSLAAFLAYAVMGCMRAGAQSLSLNVLAYFPIPGKKESRKTIDSVRGVLYHGLPARIFGKARLLRRF
jgi:hypothetical protein